MMAAISGILHFLLILGEVVILFNLLIVVHELGHFWAARWRGMVVERFAIWFGPAIWKRTIGGVEYRLGCIPAGGYVALPQMAPMEMLEGDSEYAKKELPPVTPWDRILVALAGPVASFGLAIVFAVLVNWVGRPVNPAEASTQIGYVHAEGPAARAGLRPGDRVVAVDGRSVNRFSGVGDSISWRVISSDNPTIRLDVMRDGQPLEFHVVPEIEKYQWWQRAGVRQILIGPALPEVKVGSLYPHSPAAEAGMRKGDLVTEVGGMRIYSPNAVATAVEANPKAPVALTVRRGAQEFHFNVRPQVPTKPAGMPPMLGIMWDFGEPVLIYPSVGEQLGAGLRAMGDTLSAVVSPSSDVKLQHLQGPVGIMRLYYLLFESPQGWRLVFWFTVVININLAILNLLPLPVLDGGHILLAVIEWLRGGKPLNVRLLEWVQTTCAVALMGLMLYIAFYDVQELAVRRREPKTSQIEFSRP